MGYITSWFPSARHRNYRHQLWNNCLLSLFVRNGVRVVERWSEAKTCFSYFSSIDVNAALRKKPKTCCTIAQIYSLNNGTKKKRRRRAMRISLLSKIIAAFTTLRATTMDRCWSADVRHCGRYVYIKIYNSFPTIRSRASWINGVINMVRACLAFFD